MPMITCFDGNRGVVSLDFPKVYKDEAISIKKSEKKILDLMQFSKRNFEIKTRKKLKVEISPIYDDDSVRSCV